MSGIIKILNSEKNFGFIKSLEAGKKVLFFDQTGLASRIFSELKIGDYVEFSIDESDGRRAINIS